MTGSTRALRGSVLIALAVVITDQATKHWAVNRLADDTIDLFWTLRFNLVFNSGMAFGRGQGFGPVIGVVSAAIVVALLVAVHRGTGALGTSGRLGTVGTGLVVGGAVGNLIDRLFRGDAWLRGAVVDFVDLQWFPVFNVADAAVNVGAGVLILGAVLQGRHEHEHEHEHDDDDDEVDPRVAEAP